MSGTIPRVAGLGVRARAVRQVFPNGVVALDGVSLDVAGGEFVAVLGPSGCGKSTFLRLVAGLDRPTDGDVEIENPEGAASAAGLLDYVAPSRRAGIAYVFQDAHLLPWRNVLQNVALPLELMRARRKDRLAAAAAALEQVGLADALDRYPAQLSGGMKMRVSIARAMVTDPQLLLLDEPFAAIDEITRQRLDAQLRELWLSRRMTVLFVTHSTTEAVYLAERAVVLSAQPGRVILDQPINLPPERPADVRATSAFARQTRGIYEALEFAGGAP